MAIAVVFGLFDGSLTTKTLDTLPILKIVLPLGTLEESLSTTPYPVERRV